MANWRINGIAKITLKSKVKGKNISKCQFKSQNSLYFKFIKKRNREGEVEVEKLLSKYSQFTIELIWSVRSYLLYCFI